MRNEGLQARGAFGRGSRKGYISQMIILISGSIMLEPNFNPDSGAEKH